MNTEGEGDGTFRSRLVRALERYFSELGVVWQRASPEPNYDRRLIVETRHVAEDAKRLPITKVLVRGSTGTTVKATLSRDPTFEAILPDGQGVFLGLRPGGHLVQVYEAWGPVWDELMDVLLSERTFRRLLLDWKTTENFRTLYEDYVGNEDYHETFYAMATLSECLARFLSDKNYKTEDLRRLELSRDEAQLFAELLIQTRDEEVFRYETV